MPDKNNSDIQLLLGIIDQIVVEISRQQPEVTLNKLWDLVLKKAGLRGNREYWSTQVSLVLVVRRLIEDGLVVGRVESGSLLQGTKICFDVTMNNRLFAWSQSKSTQNIKRTVLDLGTKFTRLQVAEIAESCGVADEALIIATMQDMIAKHQVDARYFASTKAVAFNQQANIAARDAFIAELEAEFASWGKKGQAGKTG